MRKPTAALPRWLQHGIARAERERKANIIARPMRNLMDMLRHGEAARASSVFFLVPPLAAFIAWMVLGDEMAWLAIAGTAVAVVGVALVVAKR